MNQRVLALVSLYTQLSTTGAGKPASCAALRIGADVDGDMRDNSIQDDVLGQRVVNLRRLRLDLQQLFPNPFRLERGALLGSLSVEMQPGTNGLGDQAGSSRRSSRDRSYGVSRLQELGGWVGTFPNSGGTIRPSRYLQHFCAANQVQHRSRYPTDISLAIMITFAGHAQASCIMHITHFVTQFGQRFAPTAKNAISFSYILSIVRRNDC